MEPVEASGGSPPGPADSRHGKRFETVLALVQDLDSDEGAIGLAASLADHVLVLHAIECYIGLAGFFPLETIEEARRTVEVACFEVGVQGSRWSAAILPASGLPTAGRILRVAEERQAQAIVVGSPRPRRWRRARGGGLREQVIRSTNLTVVVAPSTVPTPSRGRAGRSNRTGGQ
jgi:nucleotide-binding universal stress UspA family protein